MESEPVECAQLGKNKRGNADGAQPARMLDIRLKTSAQGDSLGRHGGRIATDDQQRIDLRIHDLVETTRRNRHAGVGRDLSAMRRGEDDVVGWAVVGKPGIVEHLQRTGYIQQLGLIVNSDDDLAPLQRK